MPPSCCNNYSAQLIATKEGEVAEKVKKFVAKSDGLKKCVVVLLNAALLSNAFCVQGACREA